MRVYESASDKIDLPQSKLGVLDHDVNTQAYVKEWESTQTYLLQ